MLQDMERDRNRIEKKLAQLVIHLNGALSFVDAYSLSSEQITLVTEAVNDHYEQQAEAIRKSSGKRQ